MGSLTTTECTVGSFRLRYIPVLQIFFMTILYTYVIIICTYMFLLSNPGKTTVLFVHSRSLQTHTHTHKLHGVGFTQTRNFVENA